MPGLGEQPEPARRLLREAGVTGVLTYSDEHCRLHAVSLPELRPVHAPSYEMCRPATATGGLRAFDGDVVWAGLGYGTVQVVVSEEELGREVSRWLGVTGNDDRHGFRAVQVIPLAGERRVVLADSTDPPRERVLVLFGGRRVLVVQPSRVTRDARFLRRSPSGEWFAAFGPNGLQWFDADAEPRAFPAIVQSPHAVTWSPDERWTALAADTSVYIFPTDRPDELIVRIPLAVHDLAWE